MKHSIFEVLFGWFFIVVVDLSVLTLFYRTATKNSVFIRKRDPLPKE